MGDEVEDIAPEAEEPVAVTPQSKKSELWDNFKSKACTTSNPAFPPCGKCELCENYIEVFLCHTKPYVFANRYNVGSLREICLHKLQRTLAEFILDDKRAKDIIDLPRYSYSKTTGCQ